MIKEERKKIYKDAIDVWGKVAQFDQCIEEMAELIIAINKYKRASIYNEKMNFDCEENLLEELADVLMCVEQLEFMLGEEKLSMMLDKKFEKLQKLMIECSKDKK